MPYLQIPFSGVRLKKPKPMTEKSTSGTKPSESGAYGESAAVDAFGNGLGSGAKLTPGMAPVTAPDV